MFLKKTLLHKFQQTYNLLSFNPVPSSIRFDIVIVMMTMTMKGKVLKFNLYNPIDIYRDR